MGFSLLWRAKSQAVCDQMCFRNWSSGSQEVLVNMAVLKSSDSMWCMYEDHMDSDLIQEPGPMST